MAALIYASTGATLAAKALKLAAAKAGKRHPDGGLLTQLAARTGQAVDATVRPGFDTACWAFDAGQHRIALGDRFNAAIDGKPPRVHSPSGMDRHALLYAEQLLRHEAWHGRLTERDLPALAQRCRDWAVPFGLFNLLEDARIEAAARAATADPMGGEFAWWRFTSNGGLTTDPSKLLWQLVNRDGRRTRSALPEADAEFVRQCYADACTAATSWAVTEIAQRWVARFGGKTLPADLPRTEGAIGTDSDGSVPASGRPEAPSMEADGSTLPGKLGEGVVGASRDNSKRVPWQFYAEASTYGFSEPLDPAMADRLAAKLAEVVAASASPRHARTATSGSRLHMAGIASGSEQAFRTVGRTGGVPNLTWVFDMSGSMGSDWNQHGKLFLAAVLRLLRSGKLQGSVFLTGAGRFAHLPTATTDAQLDTLLPAKDSESVKTTLEALRGLLATSHATVVYTDGQLTDGRVDAALWRARGVDLIGACVIPAHYDRIGTIRTGMVAHFGRVVTGTTGYDLATKLAWYSASHLTKVKAA